MKSRNAIESSQLKTSRFGVKGSEDLGNGITANFQSEMKIPSDFADNVSGRNSWVSLKSASMGELKMGSFGTFQDDLMGATNVMFNGGVASLAPRTYIETSGSTETGDLKNAIAYFSPSWSGMQVKLGMSTHANAGNDADPIATMTLATGNDRVYTAAVHYASGPLIVGATYEKSKYQDFYNAPKIDSGNAWNLAAAYDFGMVRVNGAYGVINYAQNTGVKVDDRKQWLLAASAPVGSQGTLAVSYAHAKIAYNNTLAHNDDTVSAWGVGYLHALSKRTRLYAAYGDINQDDSNYVKSRLDGATTTSNAGYQTAFQVGVRHDF